MYYKRVDYSPCAGRGSRISRLPFPTNSPCLNTPRARKSCIRKPDLSQPCLSTPSLPLALPYGVFHSSSTLYLVIDGGITAFGSRRCLTTLDDRIKLQIGS